MKPDDMPVMPASPCSRAATSAALPPAACDSAATASAATQLRLTGPPSLKLDRAQDLHARPRPLMAVGGTTACMFCHDQLRHYYCRQAVRYNESLKSRGPYTWLQSQRRCIC